MRLYSPYPFPWRKAEGGLKDQFDQDAWDALIKNPDEPFYRFEAQTLRYATADLMRESCINCHNSHPETPKDDWRTGDVRGILEIVTPLTSASSLSEDHLKETFILFVSISVLGIGLVTIVIYSLRALVNETKLRASEAEKANKLKSVFLANISHELRTPMHSIIGFVKLSKKKVGIWSKEKEIENLQVIQNNGERLLDLLNDLLDLSKLEAGTVTLNFKKHDLQKIVTNSIKSLSVLGKEKKIEISIESSLDDTKAEVDSDKIQQVFLNLLSNAIKFSPEGSNIIIKLKETTLSVGRRASDTMTKSGIFVSVIDQGIGIPDDELVTVFDKFVQSSKTKTKAGGTGLGLAICQEIIGAHGGKLWAKNNSDNPGTTFTMTIPRKQYEG